LGEQPHCGEISRNEQGAMSTELRRVSVVGSGLIGTSIALALTQAGIEVTMLDSDARAQALAQDLVGNPSSEEAAQLVIFATPISAMSKVISATYASNLNSSFMDISSVKTKIKEEVEQSPIPTERFLPTHPMAGREVGGAESARADLFAGRTWAFDPTGVDSLTISHGLTVIELCGATALSMGAKEHDQAVALTSHLPQIISSLLAIQLAQGSPSTLDLAGAGLRDTTRIAASSPALWQEIIVANSAALKPLLAKTIADLSDILENIENEVAVGNFIEAGNRGRNLIPGKHGGVARNYTFLPVVIEDRAGELARLFDACALAQVNVEDLSIEHSPEQLTGLITLALSENDATILHKHLLDNGWRVHLPRQ